MLPNTLLTAWQTRTGSDASGRPVLAAQALAADVAVILSGLSVAQQAALAAVGQTADSRCTYAAAAVAPGVGAGSGVGPGGLDVQAGDRVTVGGSVYDVVRAVRWLKGAVSHVELTLRRVDG